MKKRPTLTVIEGGKPDAPPLTLEIREADNFSIRDYLQKWQDMVTSYQSKEADDLIFVPIDYCDVPGIDLTTEITISYTKPSQPVSPIVTPNMWIDLANMVDRWRAAQDEFTIVALDRELRDWLNRK